MKRQYDILHAVILVSFLVIANFIGNEIIKGILLMLFSAVLIVNSIIKLRTQNDGKSGDKLFYSILLFLDAILVVGSIFLIVTAAI